MEQYVIYLRKSRADIDLEKKGDVETLARHEKTLSELAIKMRLFVSKIYREVVSGETIAARPLMQQLLIDVEKGVWTGVLVMEVERLARGDGIDQGIVARAFKESNTKIITPQKIYDPNNEFDEEYFEFGLFMSRREYKTINRRIQRGRIASVNEGKAIMSTPPYGYDKVKIKGEKGYTLRPNEIESKIVKLIFDLYNQGYGFTLIAKELDRLNIKPKRSQHWSKETISDILQNPVYIGKIRWSYYKNKKINLENETKIKRIKNDEYLYVDGIHTAIISDDDFFRAQSARKSKTQNTPIQKNQNTVLKNSLAGIVFCKKCGSSLTRLGVSKRNKYETLRCSNKTCDNVSAPIFLVEQKIIKFLCDWLYDYEILIDTKYTDSKIMNYIEITKKSIGTIRKDLSKIQKQISQTYDNLELKIYTVDIFQERLKVLSQKEASLINSLKDLESKISVYELDQSQVQQSIQCRKALSEYYNIKSIQERNRILKLLVSRIEYLKTSANHRGQLLNDNFELTIYPTIPKI